MIEILLLFLVAVSSKVLICQSGSTMLRDLDTYAESECWRIFNMMCLAPGETTHECHLFFHNITPVEITVRGMETVSEGVMRLL